MLISAVLLLLPALALSATELLLEPSGGKAILVDTALLDKRDVTAQQTELDRQNSQDTVQVTPQGSFVIHISSIFGCPSPYGLQIGAVFRRGSVSGFTPCQNLTG